MRVGARPCPCCSEKPVELIIGVGMGDPILCIIKTLKVPLCIELIGEVLIRILRGLPLVLLGYDVLEPGGDRIIRVGGAYGDIVRLGEEGETDLAGGGEGRVIRGVREETERLSREQHSFSCPSHTGLLMVPGSL
jgi:hypothetical protein